MIARKIFIFSFLSVIGFFHSAGVGQVLPFDNRKVVKQLGAVHISNIEMKFLISYGVDSAYFAMSVPQSDGVVKYIPISFSTYRGFEKFDVKVISSNKGDEVWVYFPAYDYYAVNYKIGANAAMTSWGRQRLFDSLDMKGLRGGGEISPIIKEGDVKTLGEFHYSGEEDSPESTGKSTGEKNWWNFW